LSSTLDATYHRPLGEPSGAPPAAGTATVTLPRQTLLHATSSADVRATRVDDLILLGGATYQTLAPVGTPPGRFELLTVAAQLGWRRRLTPLRELHLTGGLVYNHVFVIPSGQGVNPVAPTASADLTIRLLERREFALRAVGAVAADYYVDPILGTTASRGLVSGGVFVALPPSWIVGLEASFATTLSLQPVYNYKDPTSGVVYRPDETTATVSLPVRHRVSKNLIVEFGGRWSDRGPRLADSSFAFHQRQVWLYFSVMATSLPVPRWFLP
jgi:hypothetical protein